MSLIADPVHQYVSEAARLLDIERLEEIAESRRLRDTLADAELERQGIALLRLAAADIFTGAGGRPLVRLEPTRGGELPAHRFGPGDIVVLRPRQERRRGGSRGRVRGREGSRDTGRDTDAGDALTGVVYRVARDAITVALDRDRDVPEEALRLDRVANDTTYRRLTEALERLRRLEKGPAARLRQVLFGLRDPRPVEPLGDLEPLDPALDDSQRAAVAFALGAPELALIHGPPGTGKTTAIVELVRQAVARRLRVLACAPSNIAADNLTERLAAAGVEVVRIGHPARLLPVVVEHGLDVLVERAEGTRIAAGIRRELDAVYRRLRRSDDRRARRELREEGRRLRDELRELESRTVRGVLARAEVILSTTVGAASPVLDGLEFDLVVIDEAAQALEPACWIAMLKGKRAVLAGDHRQLPPTIHSPRAEREGLGVTLFDRVIERHGPALSRMLTTQYRMHETIMSWSSRELYDGRLEAHPSVRGHLLADLPHVMRTRDTAVPFLFIDTAGRGFEESREESGESRANEGEADLVVTHVSALLDAGVRPEEIGVITPYNAQVDLLRRRLGASHPAIEIDSVDGFQGREKEAIVVSLVRSNDAGDVGFLADDRRTNVAVTRARRHVAIVGDSATIANHPFLERLVDHAQTEGEYRSAWEYGG